MFTLLSHCVNLLSAFSAAILRISLSLKPCLLLSLLPSLSSRLFASEEAEINFGLWFVFGLPTAVLVLLVTWGYLAAIFCDDT